MNRTIVTLGLALATAIPAAGCGGSDVEPEGEAAAAAVPTPAESAASPAATARRPQNPVRAELANYRLTMDDIRRWTQANTGLNQFAAANPDVVAALEGERNTNLTAAQSVTALEERIERVPEARAIVDSAGLDPHSYALITLVIVQVQRAEAATRQGLSLERVAAELGVSSDNVRFVREHQAEIAQLRQQTAPPN